MNCPNSVQLQVVGMAYVPWQEWRSLYEVEKGFRCGTIFAELNLPFCWKGGGSR